MKLFLIYNNINNFTTTQNFEPNFTRRPTSQNNQQRSQQRKSEIEISQQLKCEEQKNLAVGLDHGRSTMGLVSWWWLLGARSECKTMREIQQHILRVGLVSYCCGLTLISTFPSPNFQSFLHNQYHQGKKERSLPTSNLSPESLKKKKNPKANIYLK